MKNKSIGDDYKLKNPHVNLFYRAMRITTFLLFFCSFCALADNVNSQTAKVTIKRSNVTLLDVLNEIENQTNYLFIYSNDINVKRPVSITRIISTNLTRVIERFRVGSVIFLGISQIHTLIYNFAILIE